MLTNTSTFSLIPAFFSFSLLRVIVDAIYLWLVFPPPIRSFCVIFLAVSTVAIDLTSQGSSAFSVVSTLLTGKLVIQPITGTICCCFTPSLVVYAFLGVLVHLLLGRARLISCSGSLHTSGSKPYTVLRVPSVYVRFLRTFSCKLLSSSHLSTFLGPSIVVWTLWVLAKLN